ncbi:MAG TPA: hypothetical protein VFK16_02735 [Gemmatimonadaceae bacterium]|nr:hypothetical protein [Gemmatimonadaceae bacterium]
MGRWFTRMGLLVFAFGLGTYAFGWWVVAAIALAWGLVAAQAPRTPIRAAWAALIAWALLLVLPGLMRAPTFSFATQLAHSMAVPTWALWFAELVFPFVMAWSAAAVGAAVNGGPLPGTSPANRFPA